MGAAKARLGDRHARGLKRTGIAGIAVGVLALLACELPIVFALIGLGGGVLAFRLPPIVEIMGVVVAGAGVVLLLILFMRRRRAAK